jgi:hypothetical protein
LSVPQPQANNFDASSYNNASYYSAGGGGSGGPGVGDDLGPDASRDERAAALEARLGRKRVKPKDMAAIKDAHWKRYNELDKAEQAAAAGAPAPGQQQGMPAQGYRLSDSAVVKTAPPAAGAASARPAGSGASSSHVLTGQKHFESAEEARVRAQRAAVFAKADAKKKERDTNNREARWKAYNELEQQAAAAASSKSSSNGGASGSASLQAQPGGTFALSPDGAPFSPINPQPSAPSPPLSPPNVSASVVSAPPAAASSSSSSSSASVSASSAAAGSSAPSRLPAGIQMSPYFMQQMQYLLGKVRAMPPASVSLLRKILANLLKAGDQPSAEDQKFRRIKLANAKIQEAVVRTDGAMELLMAVGFVPQRSSADSSGEECLQFPAGHTLDIAQLAYQELAVFSPSVV